MAVAGTLEIDVVLNGKKARVGLNELKKRMGLLEKSAKSANKVFGKLAKFAAVGVWAKMTIDATKFGRSMSLLADRTGIATEKLAGMRSAFAAMGGKAGAVDKLIGSISKGLAGLSMGKGEYASKLAAMGISAWGANGKTRSPDLVMGDIADWTRNQLAMGRSNAEVAAFLEDAFGIDYETFKMLSLGRGGMAKAKTEMNAKTGTVETRQIENLNALYKSVALLKETFNVLNQRIAGDLAPAIQVISDLIQGFIKEFQSVWDLVVWSFKDIVGDTNAVNEVLMVFKEALSAVAKIIGGLLWIPMKLAELFGRFLAWFDNLPIFRSQKNRDRLLAGQHAQQALGMKFGSTEERLKWLADQGTDFWKEAYENYKIKKQLEEELVFEDGSPINVEDIPLVGDEVIKAAMQEPNPVYVDISNNTEVTQNPDGTFTTDTTTEVSSGGIDLIKRVQNSAVTGVRQ